MRIFSCIAVFFTLFCCFSCRTGGPNWDPDNPTTVILVRHAEQATGRDPNLLPEGRVRAQQLAVVLQRVDLDAIFSTDTRRSEETAKPVADDKRLRIQEFDPRQEKRLIDEIRRRHRGGTVLVIAEEDPIAVLTSLLDPGVNYNPVPSNVFDNMYIITDAGTRRAEVLILHYGS